MSAAHLQYTMSLCATLNAFWLGIPLARGKQVPCNCYSGSLKGVPTLLTRQS